MAKAGGITNAVNVGIAVQADWENREFISHISLNVRRLFEFLVQFGKHHSLDLSVLGFWKFWSLRASSSSISSLLNLETFRVLRRVLDHMGIDFGDGLEEKFQLFHVEVMRFHLHLVRFFCWLLLPFELKRNSFPYYLLVIL